MKKKNKKKGGRNIFYTNINLIIGVCFVILCVGIYFLTVNNRDQAGADAAAAGEVQAEAVQAEAVGQRLQALVDGVVAREAAGPGAGEVAAFLRENAPTRRSSGVTNLIEAFGKKSRRGF